MSNQQRQSKSSNFIWIVWANGKFFCTHVSEEGAQLEAGFHTRCSCQDVRIDKLRLITHEQAQMHWGPALEGAR